MKVLKDIGLLYRRKLLETLRNPVWVFMGLTTPILYLLLFAPLLHQLEGAPGFPSGSSLDVFVPGILALTAFTGGTGAGWEVIFELKGGVTERLRVTPTSRFALLAGSVLRDITTTIVPIIIVALSAIPFGYHPHFSGLCVLLLLLAFLTAITSAASSALGLILKEIGGIAAVVTGLNLPILLLSGVMLPLSLAPGWLLLLAHFNPLYYVVAAARLLSAGSLSSPAVGLAFLVIISLAILTLTWATQVYRKAVA
jgi:ABC-2 type transport system permease protein